MHYSSEARPPATSNSNTSNDTTITSTLQSSHKARLKVLPVEVTSPQSGRSFKTYAFLNDGSNATLCTTRLMRRLHVRKEKESLQISNIFGQRSQGAFKLDLDVKGVKESKEFHMTDVYALPSLPDVSDDIAKHAVVNDLPNFQALSFQVLIVMMLIFSLG